MQLPALNQMKSTFLSILINIIVLISSFYINQNEVDTSAVTTPRTLLEENYSLDFGTNIEEGNYINYYDIYSRMKNRTNFIYSMQSFLEEPAEKVEQEPDNQITETGDDQSKEEENPEDDNNTIEEENEIPV